MRPMLLPRLRFTLPGANKEAKRISALPHWCLSLAAPFSPHTHEKLSRKSHGLTRQFVSRGPWCVLAEGLHISEALWACVVLLCCSKEEEGGRGGWAELQVPPSHGEKRRPQSFCLQIKVHQTQMISFVPVFRVPCRGQCGCRCPCCRSHWVTNKQTEKTSTITTCRVSSGEKKSATFTRRGWRCNKLHFQNSLFTPSNKISTKYDCDLQVIPLKSVKQISRNSGQISCNVISENQDFVCL